MTAAPPAPARQRGRRKAEDAAAAPETRALLLQTAQQMLREEGHASLSSRRIGARAGVHGQLVHYYFGNMDNLFLELWRRFSEHNLLRHAQSYVSPTPLRSVWESLTDRYDTTVVAELVAAARHRPLLRAEIGATIGQLRKMQAGALAQIMDDYALTKTFGSPEILSLFITGMARILTVEDEFDIPGAQGTRALIEGWIDAIEPRGAKAAK